MDIKKIAYDLEAAVPDEFVRAAFFDYLYRECEIVDGVFQVLTDVKIYEVPADCEITVVSRILQHDTMPTWSQIKVVIAVGGVISSNFGVVNPKIVSAKLYFNEMLEVYSLDIPYF